MPPKRESLAQAKARAQDLVKHRVAIAAEKLARERLNAAAASGSQRPAIPVVAGKRKRIGEGKESLSALAAKDPQKRVRAASRERDGDSDGDDVRDVKDDPDDDDDDDNDDEEMRGAGVSPAPKAAGQTRAPAPVPRPAVEDEDGEDSTSPPPRRSLPQRKPSHPATPVVIQPARPRPPPTPSVASAQPPQPQHASSYTSEVHAASQQSHVHRYETPAQVPSPAGTWNPPQSPVSDDVLSPTLP